MVSVAVLIQSGQYRLSFLQVYHMTCLLSGLLHFRVVELEHKINCCCDGVVTLRQLVCVFFLFVVIEYILHHEIRH